MANILETISNIGKYGSLRQMVLYVLAQRSMNGVETISAIESMYCGIYKPSPGSIYPLLAKLSAEELIRKCADGRYEITSRGMESVDDQWQWPWWDNGSYTPYNVIGAIESNISFLQDAGAETLVPYEERLNRIIERLQQLKAWTDEAAQGKGNGPKAC